MCAFRLKMNKNEKSCVYIYICFFGYNVYDKINNREKLYTYIKKIKFNQN